MTLTEFWGLIMGTWGLVLLIAWLQLRRATTAERRKKRAEFRRDLLLSAVLIGPICLSFILALRFSITYSTPLLVPSWVATLFWLLFLAVLAVFMKELRIAFRARNADHQRSPVDSDA